VRNLSPRKVIPCTCRSFSFARAHVDARRQIDLFPGGPGVFPYPLLALEFRFPSPGLRSAHRLACNVFHVLFPQHGCTSCLLLVGPLDKEADAFHGLLGCNHWLYVQACSAVAKKMFLPAPEPPLHLRARKILAPSLPIFLVRY